MKCAKCGKELVDSDVEYLKICPLKRKLETFGPVWDRRARWEDLPSSGCGTLFQVAV